MNGRCAYCGGPPPFTKEHVWPSGICERLADYTLRYSSKVNKVFGADLTIRDVCARCNNETLSELDEYFCGLFDSNFAHAIRSDQFVEFNYDFGRLARSLLKVSYNAARITGVDTDRFARYAPVILSPDSSPVGLIIKLATISPTIVLSKNREFIKEIPSHGVRCGAIAVPSRSRLGLAVKIVQINSYRFYVVVLDDISEKARAMSYLSDLKGSRITPIGLTTVSEPCLHAIEALDGIQHWPVKVHRERLSKRSGGRSVGLDH